MSTNTERDALREALKLADTLDSFAASDEEHSAEILESPDDYTPDAPVDIAYGLEHQASMFRKAAKVIRALATPEAAQDAGGAVLLNTMLELGCSEEAQKHVCTLLGVTGGNVHPRDVSEAVAYFTRPAPKSASVDEADEIAVTLDDDARYRIARRLCEEKAARNGQYVDYMWKLFSSQFYDDADSVIAALKEHNDGR